MIENRTIHILASAIVLTCCIAVDAEDKKKATDDSPVVLQVHRYLGFRQASDVTIESDYTFKVREDGTWSYKPMVGKETFDGKLDMSGEEKMAEFIDAIAKVEPVDKTLPRIADAPKVSVRLAAKEKDAERELQVRSELGTSIHTWIPESPP